MCFFVLSWRIATSVQGEKPYYCMIKRILFPTDFSDTAQNAFRHCLMLAKQLEASVTLLHAIYPEYETMDLPVMAAKATKDKVAAARIALQSFRDFGIAALQQRHAVDALPDIELDVEIGGAVSVITTIARRDAAELIVMGTQGQHNVMERAFGSVTTGVVERADCPVLVIPEKADYQEARIAAYATDLQEGDSVHLRAAAPVLEAYHPILFIVHIQTDGEGQPSFDVEAVEERFAQQLPVLQVQVHSIREETVEEGLAAFVEDHAVDLLIMFAPQHTLLERIFRRSNTRRMALQSHVPLLLIKQ